ncbi:hypothetical protein F2Q68_00027826 [Brassica cretica]|uniref:F-box domain-containing protein n=1 Tax=Brassica cretica TaxID=69181 RepID=A0A8S9IGG3_BRACR|nr:hypothetical protein F2Q68_00027826 [Brassica cretica]
MKTRRRNLSGDRLTTTRRKTRSKTLEDGRDNSLPFPIDVIMEIFSRLPVKSIAICRCVSKTWSSVLRRRDFTELFLSRSRTLPKLLLAYKKGGELFFFSAPQPQNPDANSSPVVATYHMKLSFDAYFHNRQYYDVLTNYVPVFVTPQFRAITNDNVLEAQSRWWGRNNNIDGIDKKPFETIPSVNIGATAVSKSPIKSHGKTGASSGPILGVRGRTSVSPVNKGKSIVSDDVGEVITFKDVTFGPHQDEVRFRLIHFWEAWNVQMKVLIGIEMLLIDEKESVIQGFIPYGRIETYLPHMKAGCTYRFNKFFGSKSKTIYRVAYPDVTISFSWNFALTSLEESSIRFPEDRIRIHGFREFDAASDLRGDLYDYIGHIKLVNGKVPSDGLLLDEAAIVVSRRVELHVQTHESKTVLSFQVLLAMKFSGVSDSVKTNGEAATPSNSDKPVSQTGVSSGDDNPMKSKGATTVSKSPTKPVIKTGISSGVDNPVKSKGATAVSKSPIKSHGKAGASSGPILGVRGRTSVSPVDKGKSIVSDDVGEVITFKDVIFGPHQDEVRFRLIHFWEAWNVQMKVLIGIEMLLIDEEQESVIQGFIPYGRIETYLPHMKSGYVTISFSWNSALTALEDSSIRFPEDRIRIHGFREFDAASDLRGDLYDYIGHIKLVNGKVPSDGLLLDDAEIDVSRRVELHVQTHDDPVMKLYLWDKAAFEFIPQAMVDTIGQTRKFIVKVSNHNLTAKTQTLTVIKVLPPDAPEPESSLGENVDEKSDTEGGDNAAELGKRGADVMESERVKRAKCG